VRHRHNEFDLHVLWRFQWALRQQCRVALQRARVKQSQVTQGKRGNSRIGKNLARKVTEAQLTNWMYYAAMACRRP
jgi:hypothetical protein